MISVKQAAGQWRADLEQRRALLGPIQLHLQLLCIRREVLAGIKVRIEGIGLGVGGDELEGLEGVLGAIDQNAHQRLRQVVVEVLPIAVLLQELSQLSSSGHDQVL